MTKTNTGILIGLFFSGLIILTIHLKLSILEILVSFSLFIFPSIFISSFKSRSASLILTVLVVMFTYVSYKYNFNDVWMGVVMALTLGLPIFYYKIKK